MTCPFPYLELVRKGLVAAKGHHLAEPPQVPLNLPLLFMYILHKK